MTAIPTPANLSDFIVAEVHKQTSEEALRTKVEAKIGESVKAAVDQAFRSYGDIGKQIEQAVTNSLRIEKHLDVPAYGVMVMAVLRNKMDEVLSGLINERLSAEMADILKLAPKEVKLTDVVEKMIADLDQHDRYGTHVTCIIEESEYSKGYHHIYLDEEEDKRKYDCAVQISVDPDGKIYNLRIGQRDAKTTIIMGAKYGWEKMIFAAYCSGSKLIIPDYEPSTAVGDF